MELYILGSGTCVPYLRRGSPAFALRIENNLLLIDGGSGTIRKLLEADLDYKEIDTIFYTHLHPDHTGDMIPLLFAIKNTPEFLRSKDLSIYGPEGFKGFYESLFSVYGNWITSLSYKILINEVSISENSELEFSGFKVKSAPVLHSKNSVAYSFQSKNKEGKTASIVFSGDTDYSESLVELARDTDILILECSFPDEKKVSGHLTPSLAGRIAKESNCKRLVLTHFYPVCDSHDILGQCRKVFQKDVILAEDLMRFSL